MTKNGLRLAVEPRAQTGTSAANRLRAQGRVPLVLYGHGSKPEALSADARAFEELLLRGGRGSMITLQDERKSGETALVREIQRDPVSRRVVHADLLRVSAHESVRTRVRIATTGSARGVRDFGGVMDMLVHEIEIEGPVESLPQQLDVDVTELGIHEHVSASDIALPSGFTLITPADTVVIAIEPSKTAHQLEEAAAPAEEAQPEVIGEQPAEPQTPSAE